MSCEVLEAVPFDGDFDNDGILNEDEDSNGNGYLNDDDDDNDGLQNYFDSSNLAVENVSVIQDTYLFPNPATNGVLNFNAQINLDTLFIYNLNGQEMKKSIVGQQQLVVNFPSGIYILKFEVNGNRVVKKLLVQ
jgi:hypothetical protein